MKKAFSFSTSLILILHFLLPGNALLAQDSLNRTSSKVYYQQAFDTLKAMLTGEKELSFKKAVFITENAYLDNGLTYDLYSEEINRYVKLCKSITEQQVLLYDKNDRMEVTKHAAIFTVLTDTIPVLTSDNDTAYYLPFRYDFEDIWGEKDWDKMFVTKLLATRTGNCHSLPFLYKILAQELDTEAYLSMAPNHIYIKTWSERDGWYNTELTSAIFPIDAWLMAFGYIHLSAIQNGIYMDTLSNRQSIAVCLVDLASGYKKKFGTGNTDFILKCTDLAQEYYPNFVNALLLNAETNKDRFENMMQEYKVAYAKELFYLPEAKAIFTEMEKTYLDIHQLGYRTMPKEMYVQWLEELNREKEKYNNKKINQNN